MPGTKSKERSIRFYKPNVEKWKNYNMYIQHAMNRESFCLESFSTLIQEAADKHLEKIPRDKKNHTLVGGLGQRLKNETKEEYTV